jgi:hypothetical protein
MSGYVWQCDVVCGIIRQGKKFGQRNKKCPSKGVFGLGGIKL